MKFEKALELAKGGLEVYKKKYPDLTEQIDFQETIIKSLEMSIQNEVKKDGCDFDFFPDIFCRRNISKQYYFRDFEKSK